MLLIQNGLLYTMESENPIAADLLIQDGKIEKIAGHIDETEQMHVIDASGKRVYPGFIDAHSHIGISEEKTGVKGDDCNEGSNPVTPELRAIDAINPMDNAFHNAIAIGVTGVMTGPGSSNVIGGQFAFIKTSGRRIDDMVVLAPAAIKIAFGENPKTDYGENGYMPETRMGIAALIRKELFRARQYYVKYKNYYENMQNGKTANAEESCYQNTNNEMLDRDFQLESYVPLFEHKIPLKAHVHRADDIFTAIRIAKEFDVDLTLDHCTEGHLIAEEIAESGFPAIVGPGLASRSKDELKWMDFKTAGILQKAGVMVASKVVCTMIDGEVVWPEQ